MIAAFEWATHHPWITGGAVLATAAVVGAMVGAVAEVTIQHRRANRRKSHA